MSVQTPPTKRDGPSVVRSVRWFLCPGTVMLLMAASLLPASNAFHALPALSAPVATSRGVVLSSQRQPQLQMLPPNSFGWEEASSASSSSSFWPSLTTGLVPTAHGHTQPLWGPPDPYLTAGKSIAPPNPAALLDGAAPSVPNLPEGITQDAITKAGWNVLDASKIQAESILPGFAKTGGILGAHSTNIPAETPDTFAAQVEWSAQFLKVVDALPYAAFAYALIEFFLIRPNLDVYKEDVEEERAGVMAETVGVTVVRLGVFAVLSVVTTTFFG